MELHFDGGKYIEISHPDGTIKILGSPVHWFYDSLFWIKIQTVNLINKKYKFLHSCNDFYDYFINLSIINDYDLKITTIKRFECCILNWSCCAFYRKHFLSICRFLHQPKLRSRLFLLLERIFWGCDKLDFFQYKQLLPCSWKFLLKLSQFCALRLCIQCQW